VACLPLTLRGVDGSSAIPVGFIGGTYLYPLTMRWGV